MKNKIKENLKTEIEKAVCDFFLAKIKELKSRQYEARQILDIIEIELRNPQWKDSLAANAIECCGHHRDCPQCKCYD